jgi:hypothetical protein
MLRRVNYLLPFAVTAVVSLGLTGPLFGQTRSGTMTSSSSGSGTSLGGGSSGNSYGFNSSAFGLGSTGTGTTGSTSASPFGNAPGAGNSSTGYGSTSLFGPYFANPLATGIPGTTGTTSTKAFGQPLFNISTGGVYNTNTGTGNSGRGNAGGGRTGTNFGNTGTGNIARSGTTTTFSPSNSFRSNASPYTSRIAFVVTPPAREELRADLQRVIAQSSDLPSRNGVSVQVDGDTVVLQGQVSTNEERRLLESIVRLTPGVNVVRNELVPQTAGAD